MSDEQQPRKKNNVYEEILARIQQVIEKNTQKLAVNTEKTYKKSFFKYDISMLISSS